MVGPEDFDDLNKSLPTADIKATIEENEIYQQHTYPILPTVQDSEDYMYSIRVSTLDRWRSKINNLIKNKFPWHELLLAISTLLAGAILSALISNIKLNTDLGILFYVVLPPIFLATLVAYFFVRYNSVHSPTEQLSEVKDELEVLVKSTKNNES